MTRYLESSNTTHSVEKAKIYSHWKKFREINLQYINMKPLISRNFVKKILRVKFRNFHTHNEPSSSKLLRDAVSDCQRSANLGRYDEILR